MAKPTKQPEKVGRPSKYKPEYGELLINHMGDGYSIESFAGVLRISKDTVYEWINKHPEFSDAKKAGEGLRHLCYEKLGMEASKGKVDGFNATAFVWMTKNMLGWRDKQEITHSVESWPKGGLALADNDPIA
jgi:hypothetical protein